MKKIAVELLSLKLLLFTFGIILIQTTTAQTLKSYSGIYKLTYPLYVNGTATYTYFENLDTYERVREGNFKFVYEIPKDKYSGGITTIEGVYKNNLKHGQWSYTIESKDLKSGDYYMTGVIKVIANYNMGIPDGLWISSINGKSRQVWFNRENLQYEFGEWRGENSAKLTANFTNGMLTGKVNYTKEDKQVNKHVTVDFELDKDGFFIGKFITDEGSGKYINEFDNGFLFKTVSVNTQNGEVKVNDYTDDLELAKEIRNIKKTKPSELENMDFKLVQSSVDNKFLETIFADHFFNNSLYHFEDIKGDVNFKDGKYWYDGFKTYVIQRQISKSVVDKFIELTGLMNSMAKIKKSIPREYTSSIKEINLISDSNKLISSLDNYYLGKYDSYVTSKNGEKIKGYLRVQNEIDFFKNIPENNALDKTLEKVRSNHDLLKNKVDSLYNENINQANKSFEEKDYNTAIEFYKNAIKFGNDTELIEERLNEAQRIQEQLKLDTNEFNNNVNLIKQNKQYIEKIYTVEDHLGSFVNESAVKKKKKKLYSAYEILQLDLSKQIDDSEDIETKLEKSRELLKLYTLMQSLSNTNTNELEKQLKNQTDPKMIQQILEL